MEKTTLQQYKEAGAWMRLCKEVIAKTDTACCPVLSYKDSTLIVKAREKISQACSRAENNMFVDHPDFRKGSTDVFYGNLECEPRTDTDREQLELIQKMVIQLFGDNWNPDLIIEENESRQ